MARKKRVVEPLPTIWEVSDQLWSIIEPILDEKDPPAPTGRPRTGQRQALNGIIYQMRSGVQWNHLPRIFGDDSSVHRALQRWVDKGIFDQLMALLIENCEELGDLNGQWQRGNVAPRTTRASGTISGTTPRVVVKTARNLRGIRAAADSESTVNS